MYFNNIHILIYLIIGLIGCAVGQFVGMTTVRLAEHKKILSKQAFKEMKVGFEAHYTSMVVISILYIALLYVCGIDYKNWYANIDLISYFFLIPAVVEALVIDIKYEIIPNRLIITILEIGMISAFTNGISNPNGISIAFDRISGLFVGGMIFLIITCIGGLVAGKEAMGMGDVKFVSVLGLFFGIKSIIVISVISFLVGAIFSIFILLFKIKKSNEYIPFGPFIAVATLISIFVPESILFNALWYFFSGEWLLKLLNR